MIKANELRIGGNFANELRIGTWLTSDDNGFWKVDAEIIDVVGRRTDHLYAPIPLTPQILEKCGFVKGLYVYEDRTTAEAFMSSGRRYVIRRINIGGDYPEYWGMSYFPYPQSQNTIPAEINYLHQLQNLYFALTGEELIFKP